MNEMGKDITAMDVIESVVKSVLSEVPYVKFYIQAIDSIKDNVLQRRYEQWQEKVGKRLSDISQDVSLKLGNNDSFATMLIKATELASKTNGKKMDYLANAVKYTAENEIDEDNLIIMLNCIEKYTLSHILILKYLQNPSSFSNGKQYIAGGLFSYFDDYYPDFNKALQSIILKDLFRDGLVNTDTSGSMTSAGMEAKRTTELGDLFITVFGIEHDGK
jgi:hypothetical protein